MFICFFLHIMFLVELACSLLSIFRDTRFLYCVFLPSTRSSGVSCYLSSYSPLSRTTFISRTSLAHAFYVASASAPPISMNCMPAYLSFPTRPLSLYAPLRPHTLSRWLKLHWHCCIDRAVLLACTCLQIVVIVLWVCYAFVFML